jgi:heat shock protein HslJ
MIQKTMRMCVIITACLIISQAAIFAGGPPDPENITGIEWKWQQSLYSNDQKAVPADATSYTITFLPDGTLNVRADCNRAGGTFTAKDKSISIQVTHSTMAMCPPDSLDTKFLKDLAAAAIYFFNKGSLYLDLKYDSGTMKFSP